MRRAAARRREDRRGGGEGEHERREPHFCRGVRDSLAPERGRAKRACLFEWRSLEIREVFASTRRNSAIGAMLGVLPGAASACRGGSTLPPQRSSAHYAAVVDALPSMV